MNKAQLLRCLVLLFAGIALPAPAMPPFNYDSALSWADETVKSDIPKAERIYILGPDKVTETYLLNNKPTAHDVEVRRVVRLKSTSTLEAVIEIIPLDKKKELWVRIYRAGTEPDKPVFSVTIKDPKQLLKVPMEARDVILIEYPPPPGIPMMP